MNNKSLQEALRNLLDHIYNNLSNDYPCGIDPNYDAPFLAAESLLSAALQDKAVEVPKGYVLASETMDVQKLYAQLVDLTREAGAVDTVIGRPEVLRNNLAALHDEIGAAANGRIPLAAQPAPVVPDDVALRCRVQDLLHLLSFAKIETPTPTDKPEAEKAMADIRAMISASQQKGGQHG